ncbi:MAG: hypothetical protein JKY15_00915 [Deltaproteobacteria bacterium]|nr:hypothetical protein [Deltaproteobacteria bacterium]
MKIRLFFALVFSFHCVLLAAKDNFFPGDLDDLVAVEGNTPLIFQDLGELLKDGGRYMFLRVPSTGTLVIDSFMDAWLRQFPWFRKWLKELEKSNPTNSAVVRDGSKLVNTPIKMLFLVPVDQSGRLYDRGDMATQASKFFSKVVGFAVLDSTGMTKNPVALFVVNTGGDVIAQTFHEAAISWRDLDVSTRDGYLSYFYLNAGENFGHALRSVPVKAATGYIIGFAMNYVELDYKVGNFTLGGINLAKWIIPDEIKAMMLSDVRGLLNQMEYVSPSVADEMRTIDPELWLVSFARSFVRSLALTTGCKVATDTTRLLATTRFASYVTPTIIALTSIIFAVQMKDHVL